MKDALQNYGHTINWSTRKIIYDGEDALHNAWNNFTHNTIQHGLCILHFKDSIERYLSKTLGITDETLKMCTLAPIFGLHTVKGFIDMPPTYIDMAIADVKEFWYFKQIITNM